MYMYIVCFFLQAACLWRRALIASLEFNRIVAPTFARRLGKKAWQYNIPKISQLYNLYIVRVSGVAVSVAQGLINRLEREGYVRVPMKNKRSVDYCSTIHVGVGK